MTTGSYHKTIEPTKGDDGSVTFHCEACAVRWFVMQPIARFHDVPLTEDENRRSVAALVEDTRFIVEREKTK